MLYNFYFSEYHLLICLLSDSENPSQAAYEIVTI